MKILSLDIATKTGWCSSVDGNIEFGEIDCQSTAHKGIKFINFWQLIEPIILAQRWDYIVFEMIYKHRTYMDAHCFGGYKALMLMHLANNGLPEPIGYSASAIKKHFTGNGRAKKPDMVAEANKRGFITDSDNTADAIAILHLAIEQIGCSQYGDDPTEALPF